MPKLIIPVLFLLMAIFFVYILNIKTVTTIKFFPIDREVTIEQANTSLSLDNNDEIVWEINSISSDQAFLRQDVSLLYENGKFKGVHSQWKQNIADLTAEHRFKPMNSSRLEAISFHHAEVHHSNDTITSAQKMTNERIYLIKENDQFHLFNKADNKKESIWKEKLDKMTEQQLKFYWNKLIDHFQIDKDKYLLIPLTELYQYEEQNFPNLDQKSTKEVIGRLWEGLYKNYILLLRENEQSIDVHYIPLILVANDASHLLVIFELNGEKQKLIQQIPQASSTYKGNEDSPKYHTKLRKLLSMYKG